MRLYIDIYDNELQCPRGILYVTVTGFTHPI